MKKLLLMGALVAGLAFVGTVQTAEAGHRDDFRPSHGSFYPSYGQRSHRSPDWRYDRRRYYTVPPRHHRDCYDDYRYDRYRYGRYDRSRFGLYVGDGYFGINIGR
jgi:hypothetical protein